MASGVEVNISDRAIISALNTPGGAVFKWRDDTAEAITRAAIAASPINNLFNASHRGYRVGEYRRSWAFDRVGSNGHRVQATIFNGSDHADIVEFGRRRTHGFEVFGWTGHKPPGAISLHDEGTRGRPGKHILRDAVNARGASTGDYGALA